MSSGNKRISDLIVIFKTETDENHGLTRDQIFSRLEKMGSKTSRSTFYDDIEYLRSIGFDIVLEGGKSTFANYRLVSRDFEIAELKLLVDSVQAAKFISRSKSNAIISKLSRLVSTNDAATLKRDVILAGRVKTTNEKILYTVDELHSAMSSNRNISFRYFQWNEKKQPEYRHGGKLYEISPWALIWDNEYYYMLGFDSEDKKIKHYRVDKMDNACVSENPRAGRNEFGEIDISTYTNSVFGMFSGKKYLTTFEIAKEKAYIFIDRFGADISFIPAGEHTVRTVIDVELSPQFIGWVFSLGEGVKVLSPEIVVNEIKKEALRQAELYSHS